MESNYGRHIQRFIWMVAGLWLIAGFSKIIAMQAHKPFLASENPVFGISNGHIFMIVSQAELVGASYLLFASCVRRRLMVCSLGTIGLVAYRIVAGIIDPFTPCNCLGALFSWTRLTPLAADRIALAALVVTCVGCTLAWCIVPLRTTEEKIGVRAKTISSSSNEPWS